MRVNSLTQMATILDQIIKTKHKEIAERSSRVPVEALKERIASMDRPRNFFRAVTTPTDKPLRGKARQAPIKDGNGRDVLAARAEILD